MHYSKHRDGHLHYSYRVISFIVWLSVSCSCRYGLFPISNPKCIVQQIIEWAEQPPIGKWKKISSGKRRRKRIYRAEIPCSLLHLKTLHKFLSIPGVDSKTIAARMSENLLHNEVWDCRFKPHKFKKVPQLVASLLLDLKEAFRVPKLQRPDENGTLKRRGIIAGFVELLSKLLINKEDISATGFDQVMKELRYFVNIFWDKPFQATEHVLVQSLLAQFEGLLNEAGRVDLIATKIEEMRHICNVEVLKAEISSDAQLSQELGIGIEVDGTVVGIEKEEMSILDQLVGGTKNLQFISIVGTPGLGKTTLAKKLFNNLSVGHLFDRRSWCVVSQMYTRKKVLSDIFKCLKDDAQLKADEQDAALQIYQALYGRRYLIVLDDMWDSDVWDDLQSCFPDNKNGSRILFTSRNRDAAPVGSIIRDLPLWLDNQCWELLEKKVFGNETCRPELEGVGKKIAANCKGLPLVVVVVASILSMIDKEPSAWKVVARDIDSLIFSDQNTWVMQILKLSYKHLPKYLKPCFLCFGVFRRGSEILVKKLVQLWIAEGFIHIENKRAEDIAEDYFLELVDRSLVTISKKRSDGGAKACVIHDLLHDMCSRVAEEVNFLKNTCYYPMRVKVPVFSSQVLQSYGPWLRSFYCRGYEPLSVINMKLLRVLDYWAWDSDIFFPQKKHHRLVGLEHLVNLRYLATRLVPEPIDNLVSLEYLIVDESVCISSYILKLGMLRYLKAPKVFFYNHCILSQKNTLEFLSNVYIQNHNDIWLLKDYPQFRRLKCSCMLSVEEPLRCFDVSFLDQLKTLSISSRPWVMIYEIRFPFSIKKLTLNDFKFSRGMMSALGALQNLEVLKLVNSKFTGQRWDTSDGEFQKLRFLKLDSVNLVQWNVLESGHFPILQQLVVCHCKYLTLIPDEIGDIMTLELIDVSGCPPSVGESAMQIQQVQQDDLGYEGLTVIVQK